MNGIDLATVFGQAATPQPAPVDTYVWATVTSYPAVQVQIDGDSISVTPTAVLADVQVGQRVWCQFHNGRLIVLGQANPGYAIALGNTEDLNDFYWTGRWGQPLSANASTTRNYPENIAGFLEVFRVTANGQMVQQRYSLYYSGASFARIWWRTYYNGTWYPWVTVGSGHEQNLTPISGWAVRSGYGLMVAEVGNNLCHVNGQVVNNTGATVTSAALLAAGAFPTWARPATNTQTISAGGNGTVASGGVNAPQLEIHTDGSATLFGISLPNTGTVSLHGTYYTG